MPKIPKRNRVVRLGERTVSERTDPDYQDTRLGKMIQEYVSLSVGRQKMYMEGLDTRDRRDLQDMFDRLKARTTLRLR